MSENLTKSNGTRKKHAGLQGDGIIMIVKLTFNPLWYASTAGSAGTILRVCRRSHT
jgi:hypothetical protein